ncbi:MAG: DUF5602 domain-containing protein [Syntrophothermus sp.]
MRKFTYKTGAAILLVAVMAIQSCTKDEPAVPSSSETNLKISGSRIFYGPTVPIGNGVARAWVQEDDNGAPLAVGINLSEKALENLPPDPTQYVLYFPKNKGENFYKHMLVDWNPQGHEPPGIYDLPHFDFHFYWITNQERLAIGPAGAPQFGIYPAAQYVPPAYIPTSGVPEMGTHWIDVLSPEFNGQVFTKTFILGSWNGSFVFYEPMITRSYLLTHPQETLPVRQPSAFQQDGWYPTDYSIAYSTSPFQYTIALRNLAYHEGQ